MAAHYSNTLTIVQNPAFRNLFLKIAGSMAALIRRSLETHGMAKINKCFAQGIKARWNIYHERDLTKPKALCEIADL